MASLTRAPSKNAPHSYKDYVNFLENYKKEEFIENSKKDLPNGNFSNRTVTYIEKSRSNSTSSSNSSISSDMPDYSRNTCIPYNTYLVNSKQKKFNSVKPAVEEKMTKRSEIFIEIQPTKSVPQVSKKFEYSAPKRSINSKISIFEKQISTENKPKLAEKPVLSSRPSISKISASLPPPPPPPLPPACQNHKKIIPLLKKMEISLPPPALDTKNLVSSEVVIPLIVTNTNEPLSPPMNTYDDVLPAPVTNEKQFLPPPPPPPPPMILPVKSSLPVTKPPPPPALNGVPKIQATLNKGPQTVYSINNTKGDLPTEIDKNDPMVRKLVYGTLRGLYGAYHNKANDIVATLPRNMVVKNNGVKNIIDKIA